MICHARDTVLNLGHETRIMGIVNCTPDSFSGDGKLKAQGQNDIRPACVMPVNLSVKARTSLISAVNPPARGL